MKTLKSGLSLIGCWGVMMASGWAQDAPAPEAPAMPPAESAAPVDQAAPTEGTGPVSQEGANPDDSVSFQTFYDNLGPLGTWIQNDDYGYVWQPNVQDPDWSPYTVGHWVYTEDGWTWASDEPWGWATYHYGRWVNLDNVGWCWVPGYTWAPAWVSWRYGEGYCGWAPLPPDSFVGIDYAAPDYSLTVGYHIGGDCDAFYGIGAGCYRFVLANCLGNPSYKGCYAKPCDNFGIINHTRNVTNLNINRSSQGGPEGGHGEPRGPHGENFHGVTAGGPSLAQINAVSPRPVPQVNLVGASRPGGGTLNNQSLALYAPRFHAPEGTNNYRPANVARTVEHAQVNRGIDVTRPLAVNPQLAPVTPTSSEIQRAQLAQFNAPGRAKVLTPETQMKPVLQTPLTSLKPVVPLSTPSARNQVMAGQPHYRNGDANNVSPQSYVPGARNSAAPSMYPQANQGQVVPGTYPGRPLPQTSPSPGSPYVSPPPHQSSVVPYHSPVSPTRPQTTVPAAPVVHQAPATAAPASSTSTPAPQSPSPSPAGGGGYRGGGQR